MRLGFEPYFTHFPTPPPPGNYCTVLKNVRANFPRRPLFSPFLLVKCFCLSGPLFLNFARLNEIKLNTLLSFVNGHVYEGTPMALFMLEHVLLGTIPRGGYSGTPSSSLARNIIPLIFVMRARHSLFRY